MKRKVKIKAKTYPLVTARKRAAVWGRLKGMWKNKKPDPIAELQKMRREWETIRQ